MALQRSITFRDERRAHCARRRGRKRSRDWCRGCYWTSRTAASYRRALRRSVRIVTSGFLLSRSTFFSHHLHLLSPYAHSVIHYLHPMHFSSSISTSPSASFYASPIFHSSFPFSFSSSSFFFFFFFFFFHSKDRCVDSSYVPNLDRCLSSSDKKWRGVYRALFLLFSLFFWSNWSNSFPTRCKIGWDIHKRNRNDV